MKKIYAIFMATLVVGFVLVACGNTQEPNNPDTPTNDPEKLIVGTWETDSLVDIYPNGEKNVDDHFEGESALILYFDEEGNFHDNSNLTGTYTIEDGILDLYYGGIYQGSVETFFVDEITATSLVISYDVEGDVTFKELYYLHRVVE
ncbi:MAG: hypothetical protein MJZ96_01215 [Paludibacteraceae bacterium]|nr:hypothetical protein [Paludibacteraceae bacterium]